MTNAGRVGVGIVLVLGLGAAAWLLLGRGEAPSDTGAGGAGATDASSEVREGVVLRGSEPPAAAADAAGRVAQDLPFELTGRTRPVFGRVKDAYGRRVSGATVEVRLQGHVLAHGKSGPDGGFSLTTTIPALGPPLGAIVHAFDDQGRMAYRTFYLRPDPRWSQIASYEPGDVRTLVLLPSHTFQVVVRADREPVGPVHVRVHTRQGSALGMELIEVVARLDEKVEVGPLPEDVYRVTAVGEGFARGTAGTVLPRTDDGPVEVRLGAEHTLDVVVLDAVEKTPVPNARVEVLESVPWPFGNVLGRYAPHPEVAPTDTAGRTRIRGLGASDRHMLHVHALGYEVPTPLRECSSSQRLGAGVSETTFELARLRTIRWPIVAGNAGVPPDGSFVHLQPASWVRTALPGLAHIDEGHLVVAGLPAGSFAMLAFAPGGTVAKVGSPHPGQEAGPVTFVASRALDVVLRYADGTPAPGLTVTATSDGFRAPAGSLETGADGTVRFEGLLPGEATVEVKARRAPWPGFPAGTVDLTAGDATFAFEVPREREVVAHVRIDGVPGLPRRYRLEIGGEPVTTTEVDVERGIVRGRWIPWRWGTKTTASLRRKGYVSEPVPIRLADPAPDVIRFDLTRTGGLVLTVTSPEDSRSVLQLQIWDPSTRAWTNGEQNSSTVGLGQTLRPDSSGTARVTGLSAGRYRVVDTYALIASDAADVEPGEDPPALALDLSKSGWVKGTILGPDGEPIDGAGVRLVTGPTEIADTLPQGFTRRAGKEGQFYFRVPGDQDVTIEAFHELHRAARIGGRITLREPTEGVVLRLETGPTTRIEFDREVAPSWSQGGPNRLLVNLYRGAVSGAPILSVQAPYEGRTITFGGYEPGTYTLWVDACPAAPVVLEDVVLGEGETKIGPVTTTNGATIVLRVIPKEGEEMPKVALYASGPGPPHYGRHVREAGEELRLSGLAPGSVRVSAYRSNGAGLHLEKVVEIEGDEEIELTLDLR